MYDNISIYYNNRANNITFEQVSATKETHSGEHGILITLLI